MENDHVQLRFGVELEMILIPSFKVGQDNIKALRAQHDQLIKDIQSIGPVSGGTELEAKVSQLMKQSGEIEKEIERLREKATVTMFDTLCRAWKKWQTAKKLKYGIDTQQDFERVWTLTVDPSVKPSKQDPKRDEKFGIEIKSPTMIIGGSFEQTQEVLKEVQGLYTFLTDKTAGKCEIEFSETASTHVHISPGWKNGDKFANWSKTDILRICCAAYYWEPVIRLLVPDHRWNSEFAEDMGVINSKCFTIPDNLQLSTPGWGSYAKLPQDLFESNLKYIMGLDPDTTLLKPFLCDQRNWSWNFKPLKTYGTIECRKPPMSSNADDVLCWVELVTCTALAACNTDAPMELLGFRRSNAGFKKFTIGRRDRFYEDWQKSPLYSKTSSLLLLTVSERDFDMRKVDNINLKPLETDW